MLLQSLHTHSLYDDGQDTLARMAQNAEAAGLDALGFSGHSPLPFANDWAIDQSCLADYLREARSLQADFRGRFSLYCGLEWDSCSPLPEQKLDYLIGSVHYFPALPDGTRFTVDGSAQLLAQCAQVQFGGDMAAQADCYYALVARLAEVPQVDIVGHFDLITKFDEPHTRYPIVPPSARAAMERLVRAGKIFEINTGAISRGYRTTPYPALWLLQQLQRLLPLPDVLPLLLLRFFQLPISEFQLSVPLTDLHILSPAAVHMQFHSHNRLIQISSDRSGTEDHKTAVHKKPSSPPVLLCQIHTESLNYSPH